MAYLGKSLGEYLLRHLVALLLLALPGWAYGAGPTEAPDTSIFTSDSLPVVIATSNRIYIFSGNISSATDGVTFGNSSNNVSFHLGDDTITFGTGNGNDNYGFKWLGNSYPGGRDITIKGGAIVHGASDTTASGNRCFVFAGGCEILIDTVDAMVLGINAHVAEGPGSAWRTHDVKVRGGHWTTNVTAYTSRCQQDGAAVKNEPGNLAINFDTIAGFSYHYEFDGLTLDTSPNAGMYLSGKLRIYDCDILVDARNDNYSYPSGNTCYGSTNSACIAVNRVDAGSIIRKNNLRAGVKWFGADEGILLETCLGTVANPIYVDSNTINVHRGRDAYYGDLNIKGMKDRYRNTNVFIEYNDITVTVGDSGGNTAYGPRGVGIEIVSHEKQGCDWASGDGPDTNVVWQNNTVLVQATDSIIDAAGADTATNVGANAVRIATHDSAGYSYTRAGNIFRWNNLTSPHVIYAIAGYDAYGRCDSTLFDEDTVQWSTVEYTTIDKYVFRVGYNHQAKGNIGRDIYYSGKAGDSVTAGTAIEMWPSGDAGERNLALDRTLEITVNGNNGLPVSGASYWIVNGYGDTILTGTTGANGLISGVVRIWHEFRDGTDSTTGYNDFTFKALMDTDSTSGTSDVDWNNYDTTLVLSATAGSAPRTRLRGFKP